MWIGEGIADIAAIIGVVVATVFGIATIAVTGSLAK
jgi:hypothetical protein